MHIIYRTVLYSVFKYEVSTSCILIVCYCIDVRSSCHVRSTSYEVYQYSVVRFQTRVRHQCPTNGAWRAAGIYAIPHGSFRALFSSPPVTIATACVTHVNAYDRYAPQ